MRSGEQDSLSDAFKAGINGEWEKAAALFNAQGGSYILGFPAEVWEGRALFMTGNRQRAISLFTKALDDPGMLPQNRNLVHLYRLAATLESGDCATSKTDLDVLQKQKNRAMASDLAVLEKIFDQKCM
ncbi:MAG: hypothetical protein R3B47_08760 [Bacteroidia bacterium]